MADKDTKPATDWHAKCVQLAEHNQRLRSALGKIAERSKDHPHWTMNDGTPLQQYATQAMIGQTVPVDPPAPETVQKGGIPNPVA